MKALILAGGLGTRLRPLTHTRPKHLLPVANKPHIDHVFDLLARHGVDHVVLLTSYLSGAFDEVVARAAGRGLQVETTLEKQPLGTAGAFKNAAHVVDGAFVAFNGDILTDLDLSRVLAFHADRGAEATIVLHAVDDPSAYGVVPTDPRGRVLGFVEKPAPGEATTNLINAGTYVFEPAVLSRIPPGEVWSAERQLFPAMAAEGAALFAVADDAYWMDIGTPAKYLQANLDALSGRFAVEGLRLDAARNAVSGAAEVARDAAVSASCIGTGCRVESGAEVRESVLLPGAMVGRGARVKRCVLGAGAVVEGETILQGAVLADEEVVGPETSAQPATIGEYPAS